MPKDKSATTAKIIKAMREEFLQYGYEKASLNRISSKVGITTAGLYKHFKGKEDMFAFLVKDTLEDFHRAMNGAEDQMESVEDYDPFNEDWAAFWTDFIYDHFEGFRLLLCRSAGSKFETFEDELIAMEVESNKAYAETLRKAGKTTRPMTDREWQVLSAAYIHLMFECVRLDMTKDEAREHLHFVSELLYPGWENIFRPE